jgi:broad specificity phosphatase PhoE
MAKTRLLIVRHGGTLLSAEDRFAGSTDVALSDEGRSQAAALGRRLAATKIDAAYCSPMQRTRDTAAAILQPHGMQAEPRDGLREVDHGQWETMVHKDVEKRFAAEYAAWSADPFGYAPPGGETGLSVLNRALPVYREIIVAHPGQTVLVVSHKATNRVVICALLGMDMNSYRDRLGQDLCCLNVMEFKQPAEGQLVVLNDTSHYSNGAI